MAAWASGAWKSDAWVGTAWALDTVAPTVTVTVQRGGSSKRKRRKWKTTEEILEDLREEQEAIKYVPAPKIKTSPLELNYDLISSKIVEKIISQQLDEDRRKKRKKAISM